MNKPCSIILSTDISDKYYDVELNTCEEGTHFVGVSNEPLPINKNIIFTPCQLNQ